jgi:hypothetical protein
MNQLIEINSIGRIKFLMEYDVRKSTYENILLEQSTYLQKLAGEKGFGPVSAEKAQELYNQGKFGNLGTFDPISPEARVINQKDPRVQKFNKEKYDTIGLPSTNIRRQYQRTSTDEPFSNLWTNWDHETSGWVELGLTFGGMALAATGVGAPVGLAMIGAGTTIGVADAIKYYQEGDPYTGTMMMGLQLIPGGELVSGLAKYSPKFAKNLPKFQRILKKMAENKTLTDFEGMVYEGGIKAFNKYLPELSKKIAKYSLTAAKESLKSMTLGNVIIFFIKLLQLLGKATNFISKFVFKVGRISITIDQLWTLMATPESWRMKIRNKSDFAKMLDLLYDGTLSQSVIDGLWVIWNMIWNPNGGPNEEGQKEIKDALINEGIKTISNAEEGFLSDMDSLSKIPFNDVGINKWKNVSLNKEKKGTPVTIESILSGKQTIRKGQKGNVVREIQKMLLYLGYDLGETGKVKVGIDGDFGSSTQEAVIEFQKDNNLKDTSGVIGKETLILMKKQYEEG